MATTTAPQVPAVSRPAANKWVIAGTVVFGSFVSVMDISIVNVAMPQMIGTFGVSLDAITWVAVAYSIAEIILVTMAAWCSMLLGRKRFFIYSFILFTLASLLCGAARSLEMMIAARILQGIGAGGLIPVSQAIMLETFPERERGMAMVMPIIPRGRLMKKIHGQPYSSVNHPPITGPVAGASTTAIGLRVLRLTAHLGTHVVTHRGAAGRRKGGRIAALPPGPGQARDDHNQSHLKQQSKERGDAAAA